VYQEPSEDARSYRVGDTCKVGRELFRRMMGVMVSGGGVLLR